MVPRSMQRLMVVAVIVMAAAWALWPGAPSAAEEPVHAEDSERPESDEARRRAT